MKKLSFILNAVLLVVVAALVADNISKRAELKEVRVELAQWELYSVLAMNQMWGLSYDEFALTAPERKLPKKAQERLLALVGRVEGRVDRCTVSNAQLAAKLGGYYKPFNHDEH